MCVEETASCGAKKRRSDQDDGGYNQVRTGVG